MLVLAYPETVVRVSDEWFCPLLPYVGIGSKNFVRAGHAALVLIEKPPELLNIMISGVISPPGGQAGYGVRKPIMNWTCPSKHRSGMKR